MKRRDLIKRLEDAGWKYLREGDHTIYHNPMRPAGSPVIIQIPKHREINEITARKILKDAGLS